MKAGIRREGEAPRDSRPGQYEYYLEKSASKSPDSVMYVSTKTTKEAPLNKREQTARICHSTKCKAKLWDVSTKRKLQTLTSLESSATAGIELEEKPAAFVHQIQSHNEDHDSHIQTSSLAHKSTNKCTMIRFNILRTSCFTLLAIITSVASYDIALEQQAREFMLSMYFSSNRLPRSQSDELVDENQALWQTFMTGCGYTMIFFNGCFCPPEYRGPYLAVVNSADEVASAMYVQDSSHNLSGTLVVDPDDGRITTIQGTFDRIQQALDQGAADLSVTYDPVAGYPSDVYIDWELYMADEETRISIRNVTLL